MASDPGVGAVRDESVMAWCQRVELRGGLAGSRTAEITAASSALGLPSFSRVTAMSGRDVGSNWKRAGLKWSGCQFRRGRGLATLTSL